MAPATSPFPVSNNNASHARSTLHIDLAPTSWDSSCLSPLPRIDADATGSTETPLQAPKTRVDFSDQCSLAVSGSIWLSTLCEGGRLWTTPAPSVHASGDVHCHTNCTYTSGTQNRRPDGPQTLLMFMLCFPLFPSCPGSVWAIRKLTLPLNKTPTSRKRMSTRPLLQPTA